ncbi:MAG: hypothetical protein KDC71_15130 [Acidobacteria bacterium]|nr:hypothetical protein [Acidobacteriota bacterium]
MYQFVLMVVFCGLCLGQVETTQISSYETDEELMAQAAWLDERAGFSSSGDQVNLKRSEGSDVETDNLRCGFESEEDALRHLAISQQVEWELDFEHFQQDQPYLKQTKPNYIYVVWHNIRFVSGHAMLGHLSNSQIANQISVVNQAIGPFNFRLVLTQINRYTTTTVWDVGPHSAAINQFRKNHYVSNGNNLTMLNIYSLDLHGYAGWGHYPWLDEMGDDRRYDGILVDYQTLPGGADPHYNQGKTLTHEWGHWLGLKHPFDAGGRCVDSDGISDTYIQSRPTSGCPFRPTDSCPDFFGYDNSHNYMDYSDDPCLTQFTSGQVSMMYFWWNWRLAN